GQVGPPAVQPAERLLDDIFGARPVAEHDVRQPHQPERVRLVQRRHARFGGSQINVLRPGLMSPEIRLHVSKDAPRAIALLRPPDRSDAGYQATGVSGGSGATGMRAVPGSGVKRPSRSTPTSPRPPNPKRATTISERPPAPAQ